MSLMESLAATPPSLYRLYNTLAAKYFPKPMPVIGKEFLILAEPLQAQRKIGSAWFPGIDANGMVTSTADSPIQLFLNPFLLRYPRLMYIVMAHEMVHVYCHHQFKLTGDVRWLDDHGPRFHKVAAGLIAKGLVGVKTNQDIVKLPHSYPVVKAYNTTGGLIFLRLEDYSQLTMSVLSEMSQHCDTSKPFYIGEMDTSIIGIFAFVERGKIVGNFIGYGDDPQLALKHEKEQSWTQ